MQEHSGKNRSKELLSGIIIYGIGSFGTKILSFFIAPVYTYFIDPNQMGTYDLLITTVNLLIPLLGMQIGDAVYAFLMKKEQDNEKYIDNTYHIILVNMMVSIPLIILVSLLLHIEYWYYLVIILPEELIFVTLQKVLRGLKRQKLFVMSSIVYTVVFLTMNVVQICYLKRGINGMFVSVIAAYGTGILCMLASEPEILRFGVCRRDKGIIKEMLHFSVPLIPNQLNWWIMNSSDRYIIKYFMGNAYNGIYAIAYKFPTLLQTIFSLFNNSWQDVNLSEKQTDLGEYYSGIFRKYVVFAFSLLLSIIPLSKIFILLFMSSAYKEAADYVPFLYLGTVFQTFAAFYGVGYLKDRNTKGAAVTSIYGAVVNATVNIALIRYIGLQAASFSTFAGYLVMWIMRVRQTRDTMQIRIVKKEFASYFFLALLWCAISIYGKMETNIVIGVFGSGVFIITNGKMLKGLLRRFI